MSNQKVELIDFLLKLFLQHVGFLNKCDRNPNGNAVVAAFDEIGLSTNIPQFLGLQTVRSFLLKYKETGQYNFDFRINRFYIEKKTFVFDNEYILQLQGTAKHYVCTNLCKPKHGLP